MVYDKDSLNGSESSGSDHSEAGKKGDAGEINVDNIVDNENRNIEMSNVVNHIGELLRSNQMYNLCHVFPQHEIGIKGEETNKFTKLARFDLKLEAFVYFCFVYFLFFSVFVFLCFCSLSGEGYHFEKHSLLELKQTRYAIVDNENKNIEI